MEMIGLTIWVNPLYQKAIDLLSSAFLYECQQFHLIVLLKHLIAIHRISFLLKRFK